MNCTMCHWSHEEETQAGPKLQCRYEVKLVVIQTRMSVQMQSSLTRKSQPVQKYDYGTTFPEVKPDWWCSHFEEEVGRVN